MSVPVFKKKNQVNLTRSIDSLEGPGNVVGYNDLTERHRSTKKPYI